MNRREFLKKSLEGIVIGSIPFISCGKNPVKSEQETMVEKYFPLHVGNSWTYTNGKEEKTFTIIGTKEINGNTYYKFDDYFKVFPYISLSMLNEGDVTVGREVLFRHVPIIDRLLRYFDEEIRNIVDKEDVVRYDFLNTSWSMFKGWTYTLKGYTYPCRLKEADVNCNVPAGEFNDCLNFQFGSVKCGPDAYYYGEYLAPNVGNVKYVVPGGEFPNGYFDGESVNFQLKDYKIVK